MKKIICYGLLAFLLTSTNLYAKNFTLQILHLSDGESGVEAIENAPNFIALSEHFEKEYENTIILSAGDNYLPGPFLSASAERSIGAALQSVYRELYPNVDPAVFGQLRSGAGRVDIALANILQLDASALGNHELDHGSSFFSKLIKADVKKGNVRWFGTTFPYLSSNFDFSEDSATQTIFTSAILKNTDYFPNFKDADVLAKQSRIAPSVIIERSGEKIGVVGVTTPMLELISSVGNIKAKQNLVNDYMNMQTLASIVQPEIDRLIEQSVNKIIIVSHLQLFDLDKQLAGHLKGVDVVISGGSDTRLMDDEDLTRPVHRGDEKQYQYPVIVKSASQKPVVIVSTDGNYKYVGRLVVTFDESGNIIQNSIDDTVSGAFATTDAVVNMVFNKQDPFVKGTRAALAKQLVDAIEEVILEKDGTIIGKTNVYLEGRREYVRTRQTNFGQLITDLDIAFAKSYDPSVSVSIRIGGGIRNPIGEIIEVSEGVYKALPPKENTMSKKQNGEISRLDIESSLRFNNKLVMLTLKKEQLLEVLEHAVRFVAPGRTPGAYAQIGGLRVTYDSSKAPGDRVVDVYQLGTQEVQIIQNGRFTDGCPPHFRIITADFLAKGGDGYPFKNFIEQDKGFTNAVLATSLEPKVNRFTFAPHGSEQDVFAEYFYQLYADKPFDISNDNLSQRVIDIAQ